MGQFDFNNSLYQRIASCLDYSFLTSDYSELEEIISTFNDMPGLDILDLDAINFSEILILLQVF